MRSVDRLEGLAISGTAEVGPLRFRTPAILNADGAGPDRLSLSTEPAPSGSRRLVLSQGTERLTLEVPVLAPEVAPASSGVVPLGGGCVYLHAPLSVPALRELRGARPELLVLGNARALWNDGEALVEAVRAIRTEVGGAPLLWGPRLAHPHRVPLLVYLGFDVLDTTEGELRAADGDFLDVDLGARPVPPDGPLPPCDCPACGGAEGDRLAAHARAMYRRTSTDVSRALATGSLRSLVESRLPAEPAAAEILRYADRALAELLESRAPLTVHGTPPYVLAESLRRPEMRRFRDRLVARYRPPPSKSVLLLVPCSRTKPYRRSPSHRRFAAALEGLPGVSRVHVVSVSSPIGVVPRELEDLPPARNYDVPVTGDWSAEEREIVLRGVRHLLAAGRYRRVVAHLDPEEYGFVLEALPGDLGTPATVLEGRATSAPSIARLRDGLARALDAVPPPTAGPLRTVEEELREVASVQFGRLAADRLFAPPCRLAGRPWFQRLTDGAHDLASLREERGLFHLTIAGALRLGDALPRVDVEPTLSLEGDVFAPGVLRADPAIRTGDAVGLFQPAGLAAVGEAVLPGPLLGDLRRGLAVRVRHRHHADADTAKTVPPPPLAGR